MTAWRARLRHFRRDHYQIVEPDGASRGLVVHETEQDGAADVTFRVGAGRSGVALALGGQDAFPFLLSGRHADGALLTEEPDGAWCAIVVECKKTLREKELGKAQEQLQSSLVRLQMVADFLNLPITRRQAWVATRDNRLAPERSADPALRRRPIGPRGPTSPEVHAVDVAVLGKLDDPLEGGEVALHVITLDDQGQGSVEL